VERTKRFFLNGLILASTTVFLRGAGVAFNVYITNKIGAEGIGLFGLIMSVYMLATTIASSGAGLAATRLVAEEMTKNCGGGIKKSMTACMAYTAAFGLLAAVLLFTFAPYIGTRWLCDERTVIPLYLLSVSLPFIAMSSAMSGYFVAVRRIAKSASAQIFELLVKVVVTVLALNVYGNQGIEYACIAVVGGGSVAEICSFVYLFVLYKLENKQVQNRLEHEQHYTKRLLKIALPVAISSYLRSGLVTLEHLLVPRGLKKYGASSSASLAQYGVVHGMVMPVILFPAAMLGAFSGLLVPEFAEFQQRKHNQTIRRVTTRALHTTLLFSVGMAGIFFVFAKELGMAIYHSGDAGLFMSFLAPLIPVMYADGVVDSILKGLNQQVYSMGYNIIDSAVSVVLIYVLLPKFGVHGYVAVIFITEILNGLLSLNRLIKITDFTVSLRHDILLPVVSITSAAWGVRFLMMFNGYHTDSMIYAYIFCTAGIYIVFLKLCGCFKRERL